MLKIFLNTKELKELQIYTVFTDSSDRKFRKHGKNNLIPELKNHLVQ